MSRVEKLSVPRDFPESGMEPFGDMAARLGRREEERKRVVDEGLIHNPALKRRGSRKRRPVDKKIKVDVFHWPLGSGRKRY